MNDSHLKEDLISVGTIDKYGKLLSFPYEIVAFNFQCDCGFVYSHRIFTGKEISASFGVCPRCNNRMKARNITFDRRSLCDESGVEFSVDDIQKMQKGD